MFRTERPTTRLRSLSKFHNVRKSLSSRIGSFTTSGSTNYTWLPLVKVAMILLFQQSRRSSVPQQHCYASPGLIHAKSALCNPFLGLLHPIPVAYGLIMAHLGSLFLKFLRLCLVEFLARIRSISMLYPRHATSRRCSIVISRISEHRLFHACDKRIQFCLPKC